MVKVSYTFDTTAFQGYGERARKLEPVMGGPVLGILRDGVRAQIATWPRSHAFGERQPSNLASLKADWLNDYEATDKSVALGVNRRQHWYVNIFQHDGPMKIRSARSRAEKLVKAGRNKGRLSQQIRLGIKYGLWISAERLRRGFTLLPRRVFVSDQMAQAATREILDYIVNGDEVAT